MWVGPPQADKPNKAWSRLNPTYKGKMAKDKTNSNFCNVVSHERRRWPKKRPV
jgi:hypothetical protein